MLTVPRLTCAAKHEADPRTGNSPEPRIVFAGRRPCRAAGSRLRCWNAVKWPCAATIPSSGLRRRRCPGSQPGIPPAASHAPTFAVHGGTAASCCGLPLDRIHFVAGVLLQVPQPTNPGVHHRTGVSADGIRIRVGFDRVRAVAPNLRGPQAQPTSGGILVRGQYRIRNTGDRRPAEVLMQYGAVDVYYPPSGGARAALLVATDPTFATVVDERVAWLAHVAPYEPGSFFRRELPATRAVVDGVQDLGLLVVDGYVDLDPDGRPGLGAHVHDE